MFHVRVGDVISQGELMLEILRAEGTRDSLIGGVLEHVSFQEARLRSNVLTLRACEHTDVCLRFLGRLHGG